jgi:hypothetical protein
MSYFILWHSTENPGRIVIAPAHLCIAQLILHAGYLGQHAAMVDLV